MRLLQATIRSEDKTVAGFNVGSNCGEAAGQTVGHAHIHLIPRRMGDTPDPMGEVRCAIAERRVYRAK
jgi:diadenosine tetraphosphate (Ap4A) HIT family hydrolase